MRLHFRAYGDPQHPAVLILHGLFGASDNWATQARALGEDFHVLALDLRNHGQSPRAATMDYRLMARDVQAVLDAQGLTRAHLIGHSMGGKTAMELALDSPARIASLVVVDIAPRVYPRHHDQVLAALAELPLDALSSRADAEARLAERIGDRTVAAFLVKNLNREHGRFSWRINVLALRDNYNQLMKAPAGNRRYDGPTLFVKGGDSDYVTAADREPITRLFPAARLKIVQNAGHWPHADKPKVFAKIVGDFLHQQRGTG